MNRSSCFALSFVGLSVGLLFSGCGRTSGNAITIGATFPLTGDNATYGENLRNAIEIQVGEINAQGGIGGRMVKVIYQDDANDPKQAVSNLQRFANVDRVPAVIGSAGSNCTKAMAPIANSTRTVIISPTSSQEDLSQAGPFFFRTCPSDAYQGRVIAKLMRDRGYAKVAVFYVTNSWGVGMKDKFVREFEGLGGKVLAIESGDELAMDYRTQLAKLKQSGADALFMPTYSKQGGRVVQQAREIGIKLPLFGCDPWDVTEFREAAGSAAEGVLFTVFDQYTGPEYQRMAAEYRKRYNKAPDFIAASGYDCMLVLGAAMKQLAANGKDVTGPNIRDTLRQIKVTGATGLNQFDRNGNTVGKQFTTKTITQGKVAQL
jgi:branched-chain amino acid transport system substrate-binding protein